MIWGIKPMPMRALLNSQSFGPEEINVLVAAFEATLQQQGLVNRNDPAALRIAERILALAQDGERDPIRLREGAVKSLR